MKTLRTFALFSFLFLQLLWPFQAYSNVVPFSLGWLGAAPAAGEGAALAPLAANPVGAAVVAIGAGYMLWQANNWDNCKGIALIARAACKPNTWTRDSNGNLVPPTIVPSQQLWYTGWWLPAGSKNPDTAPQICATMAASVGASPSSYPYTYGYCGGVPLSNAGYICPSGYSVSGSNCALTNPAAVKKPTGTPCQIVISGGAFVYDPQNSACPAGAPSPYTENGVKVEISPDGKTMTLTGPNGAIAVISLGSNISIQQATPMTDSNGSPITQLANTQLSMPSADGSLSPTVQKEQVVYQNGQGDPLPASGTMPSSPITPNLTNALDCSMISSCDWAKSSIQQSQYSLQQLQYQNQQQALQAQQQTATNTGSISSAVQSIRDFINPPSIPDTDLSVSKPKNESVPITLDDSDKFMGGTAGCPPPLLISISLGNQSATIPLTYEPLCMFASYMRPFFILSAYIAAAFIIFRN